MATTLERTRPTATAVGTDAGTQGDPAWIRPSWRGWIHRIAFLTFVPLAALLVALAPSTGTRVAIVVYALGVSAMLGVSAVYHSGRLRPSTLAWMKRVDHSAILAAIAGSYSAVAVLALPAGPATFLLVFTWIAATIGVAVRMIWLRAPYPVAAAVYVAVGWGALLQVSAIVHSLGALQLTLLLGGGLAYTAGAVIYAVHRPNPWPATFGYHEIFHALVTVGVIAHYLLVADLLLVAR